MFESFCRPVVKKKGSVVKPCWSVGGCLGKEKRGGGGTTNATVEWWFCEGGLMVAFSPLMESSAAESRLARDSERRVG